MGPQPVGHGYSILLPDFVRSSSQSDENALAHRLCSHIYLRFPPLSWPFDSESCERLSFGWHSGMDTGHTSADSSLRSVSVNERNLSYHTCQTIRTSLFVLGTDCRPRAFNAPAARPSVLPASTMSTPSSLVSISFARASCMAVYCLSDRSQTNTES